MGKPKHSLEFRIAVINYYLSGQGGTTRTAAHFSIHKSTVSHWVASWKMHGIDGITWKNERYSPEFKLKVVLALRNDHLSFREAAVRFNISDNKVVKRWLCKYPSKKNHSLLEIFRHTEYVLKRRSPCVKYDSSNIKSSSVEVGRTVKDACRGAVISEASYYNWKAKYGGMEAADIKKIKDLEDENRRLKQMFADLHLECRALKDVIEKCFKTSDKA